MFKWIFQCVPINIRTFPMSSPDVSDHFICPQVAPGRVHQSREVAQGAAAAERGAMPWLVRGNHPQMVRYPLVI